jgi:predicted HAD superfamily phosphohydrolase YqeG
VPISESEGFFTKINRMMERIVFRWMKEKGMLRWGDRP